METTTYCSHMGPLNGQLHILDQIVIHFIRFYNQLVSSDNSIVSFIARLSMSNRMSYLRSNICLTPQTSGFSLCNILEVDCTPLCCICFGQVVSSLWKLSYLVCSGLTCEIYSGGGPSTYVYCMVCNSGWLIDWLIFIWVSSFLTIYI